MVDFSKYIRAYALQNALEFGKADEGRILPKLFQHGLEKNAIRDVLPVIKKIVKEVNLLSASEQASLFESLRNLVKVREEHDGALPELEDAHEGKVVTRLSPEPSKYMHLGHALIFLIQYQYAQRYKGRCVLRFEDTNPEKSTREYYDAMKADLKWLGITYDEEIIASNNLEQYYAYALKLINQKDAFVCSCTQETVKSLREKMEGCPCRSLGVSHHVSEWNAMIGKKFKEGERTVRLKGDMTASNGILRDPVIFRISYAPHFIQKNKYCVWPMYDFENTIEDALEGITHVIRSLELELRDELHQTIASLLKLTRPIVREIGRYRIAGAETQGRVLREQVASGNLIGWDDPRLVTIRALRRRGFVPEMFHELAKRVGLSRSSGQIEMSVPESINKSLIDDRATRYFFVSDPQKIIVKGAPSLDVRVPLHPSDESRGTRSLHVGKTIFISKKDYEGLPKKKGIYVRLMHLYTVKATQELIEFYEQAMDASRKPTFMHWLPADATDLVNVEIMMPDASIVSGLAEHGVVNCKVGDHVQFERVGYCVLDEKKPGVLRFWFTHS